MKPSHLPEHPSVGIGTFSAFVDPEGVAPGSLYALDDWALASRLAFFLWSAPPDGELLELAAQGRLSEERTYDADGHRTSVTDALGRVTRYSYDARGRPIGTIYPDGSSEQQQYNGAAEMVASSIRQAASRASNTTARADCSPSSIRSATRRATPTMP